MEARSDDSLSPIHWRAPRALWLRGLPPSPAWGRLSLTPRAWGTSAPTHQIHENPKRMCCPWWGHRQGPLLLGKPLLSPTPPWKADQDRTQASYYLLSKITLVTPWPQGDGFGPIGLWDKWGGEEDSLEA